MPLKRQLTAVLTDRQPVRVSYPRKELVTRLMANRCEIYDERTTSRSTMSASSPISSRPERNNPVWAQLRPNDAASPLWSAPCASRASPNIAAANRGHSRDSRRLVALLGIT